MRWGVAVPSAAQALGGECWVSLRDGLSCIDELHVDLVGQGVAVDGPGALDRR